MLKKLNLDFSDYFNISKSILWILSIFSWLFFICLGWASLDKFSDSHYEIIWTIKKMGKFRNSNIYVDDYYPIQINMVLLYIIFIITLLFALVGFIIYMIKSTCLKDEKFFEAMMGIWTRLHSFPLILVSFLFLLGEYFYPNYRDDYYNNGYYTGDYSKYFSHKKDIGFFALFFSLIALISLIFIYIVTDFKQDIWYVVLTIKKGIYSCLIVLLWYYFWYMVYQVNEFIYPDMNQKQLIYLRRSLGIIFTFLIGIGCLLFSFFFKDIVAAFMNLLIYLGMCIHFFTIRKSIREYYGQKLIWFDGTVDIIIMVLSAAMSVFLLIKYRNKCLQSNHLFND